MSLVARFVTACNAAICLKLGAKPAFRLVVGFCIAFDQPGLGLSHGGRTASMSPFAFGRRKSRATFPWAMPSPLHNLLYNFRCLIIALIS